MYFYLRGSGGCLCCISIRNYLIEHGVCNSHLVCSGSGFELIAPVFDGGDLCKLCCKSKPLIKICIFLFVATFRNHCPTRLQVLLGFSKCIAFLGRRFHVLKVWALLLRKSYTIAMNVFVGSLAYIKKGAVLLRLQ